MILLSISRYRSGRAAYSWTVPTGLASETRAASEGGVTALHPLADGSSLCTATTDAIHLWPIAREVCRALLSGLLWFSDCVQARMTRSGYSPFLEPTLVPTHTPHSVSDLLSEPQGALLVSASGTRGWMGTSDSTAVVHCLAHNVS